MTGLRLEEEEVLSPKSVSGRTRGEDFHHGCRGPPIGRRETQCMWEGKSKGRVEV